MAVLEIAQLDKTGINLDINEYLLPPEAFSKAYNVNFGSGGISAAKGLRLYKEELLEEGEEFIKVKGIADRLYFFSNYNLTIMRNSTWEKYKYPDGFTLEGEFFINSLSNLPVMVSGRIPYGLKEVDGGHEIFQLDGWGNNMSCRSVVSYKGFLVAFGVILNGQLYEDTVFWSDISAPDTYPTDWGFELDGSGNLDPIRPVEGSLGGYNQLNAVGGKIVAAHEFGDHLYLFTENEVFRVSFIGGDLVFKFQKVLTGKGALSPAAITSLENGLVVVGSNEIYMFNGQTTQSLSNSRINTYLSEKIVAGVDLKLIRDFNEKQLFILISHEEKPATKTTPVVYGDFIDAIVWDWVSNSFSFRDVKYTQFKDITEYRADSLFNTENERWSKTEKTWDTYGDQTWDSAIQYGTGVLAIRANQALLLNRGNQIVDTEGEYHPIPWYFGRTFYNSNLGYDEKSVFRILSVTFRGIDTPQINVAINGVAGTRRGDTVYFRSTGKKSEVDFYGSGKFSLPAYQIEHSLIGRR